MRPKVCADDECIIDPAGVRFAEKYDTTIYGGGTAYGLRVTYTGSLLDHRYQTAALRDAQFQRLAAAMTVLTVLRPADREAR